MLCCQISQRYEGMGQVGDIASNNEADVGLVNVGGVNPAFNIVLKQSDMRKPSMFGRVSHALDSAGYARKQGEAALTALDYGIEMTKRVIAEFPFMSPERAAASFSKLNRSRPDGTMSSRRCRLSSVGRRVNTPRLGRRPAPDARHIRLGT